MKQLPTEAELQQFASEKREQQKLLDDLNKKIDDLKTELAKEDDKETLNQKIREFQQANEKFEAELKSSSDPGKGLDEPIEAKPIKKPTKEKKRKVSLNSVQ